MFSFVEVLPEKHAAGVLSQTVERTRGCQWSTFMEPAFESIPRDVVTWRSISLNQRTRLFAISISSSRGWRRKQEVDHSGGRICSKG